MVNQESLVSKYGIPIQHFEYSYIESCTDGRELEKIVQVLRSGEEGHFPDLQKFAEDRLAVVKPKSKYLRTACPVLSKDSLSRDERNKLTSDLTQWLEKVLTTDEELASYKNRKCDRTLPEVRESKQKVYEDEKKAPPKRISSTDYSSWEKYDPDTEILKMDLQEEEFKKPKKKTSTMKKTVKFKEFTTDIESTLEANAEKDKGNEFFRVGDYKEALHHYTNSIGCKPTLPCYTNRALTNIKLKNYKNAIDDCHSALAIDPLNIKAFVQKAQALDALGRYREALETIESAIELDPNNILAQELADKLLKQCGIVLKNTRFKVEDVRTEKETIIPIPGTSTMPPPYYITSSASSKEIAIAQTPQNMRLVSIDKDKIKEIEDDDCCPINHLQTICTNANTRNNSNKSDTVSGKDKYGKIQEVKAKQKENTVKKDYHAGGDSKDNEIIEDIHSPYNFLKTWNSANSDQTLEQHAAILRSMDMHRISSVIGCKLDSTMFSKIIKCLSTHFAVPSEVDRLQAILSNLVTLPRFDIISMLMSPEDRKCVNALINFLKQHEKPLSNEVVNKFFN